jgi:hypothetical protein
MILLKRKYTTFLKTIGWWELNRIIYNILMLIVGFISFFIGYVTIPVIYVIIGLSLNILFTSSWILEIIFIRQSKSDNLTKKYTKIFILVFYGYSSLGILLYSIYPSMLSWIVDFWIK